MWKFVKILVSYLQKNIWVCLKKLESVSNFPILNQPRENLYILVYKNLFILYNGKDLIAWYSGFSSETLNFLSFKDVKFHEILVCKSDMQNFSWFINANLLFCFSAVLFNTLEFEQK